MALRSVSSVPSATATSVAVPVPTGAAIGDIVVVGIYRVVQEAITPPAGFTQKSDLPSSSATQGRLVVFWKRLTAADAGTYSFTWATSSVCEAVASCHSGRIAVGDPFLETPGFTQSGTAGTTLTVTGPTTSYHADNDVIGIATSFTSVSWTAPTGFTEQYDAAPGNLTLDTLLAQSAGAVGSVVWTLSATSSGKKGWVGALAGAAQVTRRDATSGAPASAAAFQPTLPTHVTGDRLLLVVSGKYDTATIPTINQGWTLLGSTTGGTGSAGADTGTMFMAVYAKDAASGAETAPTVTPGGTAPNTWLWTCVSLYPSSGKAFRDAIATSAAYVGFGSDTSSASPLTATVGPFTGVQPTAGDYLIAFGASPTDVGSAIATSSTVAATGLTGGVIDSTTSNYIETTLADDARMGYVDWQGFGGTESAAAVPSFVFNNTAESDGIVAAIAIRQQTGGTTVNGGQATETNSAQAGSIVSGSVISGGLVAVTATVLAGSLLVGSVIAGGQTGETSTAQAGVVATGTIIPGDTATETNTAQAGSVGSGALVGGSQVAETSTIATGAVAQSVTGGQVTVTSTVIAGQAVTVISGGQVTVTATVIAGSTGGDVIAGGQVTVTNTALGGALVLHYYTTQTWNRAGGRVRGGYAELEWDPPVAAPPLGTVLSDEADVPFAKMYGDITIDTDGNSVFVDPQTVYGPMLTVRLVINGRDLTFWRGARTPVPDWQFTEPFGYGPATFLFEGIGPHEVLPDFDGDPDASPELADWAFPDARAKLQLVDHATQTVHSTVWRGLLEDFVEHDNDLQVIASGLWSGEASTRWASMPLFGERKDIGQLIWRLSESVAGVRMKPEGGPTTGIENHRLGEMKQIEAINLLLQRAQTRNKGPYTLTPTPWGTNTFRMVEKDTETIDATYYGEGKQVRLQRVRAGEADRIIGRGTTPGGQRVRNGRYPGVLDDPDEAIQAPPYPFGDGRSFGLGTTDADTDSESGDGIYILLVRMQTYGLIAREDVESGVFNIAAEGGINRLRFRMGLALTGLVTPNVWDALFNVGRIGVSIWWSKIEPMAQTNWSIRFNTSADGSILSHHDGYDPDRRIVDKANDYGVWRREQMFDFSDKDLDEQQTPNIFGEVDFGDHGGLLRGSVDPGTAVTDEDFMHQLELRPGMNIRFPFTRWGDIVLRFPTFAISGGSSPSVLGRGSTRPVDSLPLWETLNEARAARKNTDKLWWRQNRSSGKVSDAVGEFEEIGGQINDVTVVGGVYRVVRVLAGQIGMIERFRIRCYPEREFVAAIFGLPIGVGRLEAVCPNPLADKQGWITSMEFLNDEHRLLALWGEPGDPGGYSPGSKSAGHVLTGALDDRAGFPYKTSTPDKFAPWVHLVLYSANDTVFFGGDQGRILWNQELVGQ